MRDAGLAAYNVSVTYGRGATAFRALQDVSLEFEPGQITLLMGASGSGKTTLLSILGCLRKPDQGSVRFLGRDLARASESELGSLRRNHIGFVFQFFRLFRALSALENVKIGLQLSAQSGRSATEAEEALNRLGLQGKHRLLPAQMSGGERQRVAIARALVKNPAILLADEPTAALDGVAGAGIAEAIHASVKSRGIVAVIATHDHRLESIADRVIEMRDGRLVSACGGQP